MKRLATRNLALTAILFLLPVLLASTPGCARQAETVANASNQDLLYQVSSYSALEAGIFDGDVTYAALEEHGDLGLGTFQGLDGEMVAVDGEFYQVKVDGQAYPVDDNAIAPFAMVTFFDGDSEARPGEGLDYEGLKAWLDSLLPTRNIFYAFEIEGTFAYVKARSVPKQEKPYPPLAEAIKNQAVFEFNQARGTMVGFRCPAFVGGINVPGYHLHFLTEDKTAGGHVLELRLADVTVFIDNTPDLWMESPGNEEFYQADLK